jgi:hypothetical protein
VFLCERQIIKCVSMERDFVCARKREYACLREREECVFVQEGVCVCVCLCV